MSAPRALASVLAVAALAGCGHVAPPPADDGESLVAEPAARDEVVVEVVGRIDDPRPIGHALPVAWVGLASVVGEGEEIAAGEAIATMDPGMPAYHLREDEGRIAEQEADEALARLRTRQKLSDLLAKRDDLVAKRGVLEAGIAATRVKDEAQLSIARVERDGAERRLATAASRVERLRRLREDGVGSPRDLARAEQDLRLAEAAAKPARIRLELLEQTTYAVSRERLRLQLATLQEDLGDETAGTGLYASIRALQALDEKQDRIAKEDLETLRRDNRVRRTVIDQPVVAATAGGVVRLRDRGVRAGAKLRAAFFAYVLPDGARAVAFRLPERLRDQVRPWTEADPRQGLAEVAIDGAGAVIPGRVTAITAAPETDELGERGYRCEIRLERVPRELRPGMRARVSLRIPLASPAAVVPTWCLADLSDPRALLVDGGERALDGFALGGRFIALGGLLPGDRVRPAAAAPKRGQLRLTGVVAPTRFQPVRLSSGEWELVEAVPEGTAVQAGDVIARLAKTAGQRDPEQAKFALEFGHTQAQANLAIARIQAEEDLAQAVAAWHRAAIAVRSARLEELVARVAVDDEATARAESALAAAEVRLARAETSAGELADPVLAESVSRHERADRELELAQARRARLSAELDAVAQRREIGFLAVADAAEKARAAEIAAGDVRSAASVARSGFQAALARAQARYRDDVARLRQFRVQIADEVVRAPCAGRVYQRARGDGRMLRVGDDVWTMEPFQIPLGGGREFTVEVPARLYRRFHAGDDIAFFAPALGPERRTGRIARLAGAFVDGAEARDRIAERGVVGLPEKVFHLTVAFDLAEVEADRLPPGTTAYVDL